MPSGPEYESAIMPHQRRWPASLAVLVVVVLQLSSPGRVVPGWWPVIVILEVALLAPLVIINPIRLGNDHPRARVIAAALTVLLLASTVVWVAQLVLALVEDQQLPGGQLIVAAGLIWVTNVVVCSVAYWELDRDGPFARDPRHPHREARPDLLFPQMQDVPGWDTQAWRPSFLDYVFVAFTAATAFSPTDTLPLSGRAKVLMMINSGVSLATIVVVGARAVNAL